MFSMCNFFLKYETETQKGTLRRVSGSITVGSDTNGDGYPDVPLSYTIRVSLFILLSKRSVQLKKFDNVT
jgi:hypothetical protein